MLLRAENRDDGTRFEKEAPGLNEDILGNFASGILSERKVREFVDNLDWSADAKLLLMRAYDATIFVGKTVFKIGRFIVCSAIRLASTFPKTTFGIVAGAILGSLVAGIPLIGFVLGPIATPLAIILGTLWGALEDISDAALRQEVKGEVKRFDSFRTA
ncbi:MAG: hypothetical protein OXI01_22150 [Albidovulum sp.]|nr:hypothetical protein [Albidovulum sp.]